MVTVKNKDCLVENSKGALTRKARKLALDSLEYAIKVVDPKKIVENKVSLKDCVLGVGGYTFDLTRYRHIYVVGGGKAAGAMVEAMEEVLGDRISAGTVNVPYGCNNKTNTIKLHEASHPLPDQSGVDGVREMLATAENAGADDLMICLVSGGGSSLMTYPREDISLADKRELTIALLKSGATINEVNTVRKHLSGFKGGWLAKKAYPATVLNLILSDVVGDRLEVIASGPTVADPTTFADACGVLKKYGLWEAAPSSVRKLLVDGTEGLVEETPKPTDKFFEKVYNVVVGNNRTASQAACQYLKNQGLNTLLLTATLEGEAKYAGALLASIANEILTSNNPLAPPAAIVVGGETTVKVAGNGLGGRNQELILSAAINLKNTAERAVVVASVGTDGVDGPTDAAGAIADAATAQKAAEAGLDPQRYLADNDSYHFFEKLKDLIFTGQTGTNVNDISLIIVL
ncbi:MAG: glycerate kinase type-2 family protein [Candidatus Bathyarchaeia archaeon]|jgi:glycerate-2-kinase